MSDKDYEVDHLLTQKEVAMMLRVSNSTVGALRKNGELPHVKIGKRVLYRLTTVKAFMQNNEVTAV